MVRCFKCKFRKTDANAHASGRKSCVKLETACAKGNVGGNGVLCVESTHRKRHQRLSHSQNKTTAVRLHCGNGTVPQSVNIADTTKRIFAFLGRHQHQPSVTAPIRASIDSLVGASVRSSSFSFSAVSLTAFLVVMSRSLILVGSTEACRGLPSSSNDFL